MKKRGKKIIITAAAAGTVMVYNLTSITPVMAAPRLQNEVHGRAAEILGVNNEKFSHALNQAQIEKIEQLITNGKIDSSKGIELIHKIQDGGPELKINNHPNQFRFRNHRKEVLDFLGINQKDFKIYLEDGYTLLEIAEAKGKSEEELIDFLTKMHSESIRSNENIDLEKKNKLLDKVSDTVEKIINFSPKGLAF